MNDLYTLRRDLNRSVASYRGALAAKDAIGAHLVWAWHRDLARRYTDALARQDRGFGFASIGNGLTVRTSR